MNVSFVLHQPSSSPDVIAAASSARRDRKMSSDPQIVYDGDPDILVDRWLVPGVGLPDDIASHVTSPVKFIDRGEQPLTQARFFNAPATLSLPANGNEMVGVAALIRRPGNRSLQLIVRGPYQLPNDIGEAIRTLETIIQAHVEQWNPGVRIWDAPAENLLPDLSGGGD